jgi:hypothetical protein
VSYKSRTEGYEEGMLQYGNKIAQKSSCFVLWNTCDEWIKIFGGYYFAAEFDACVDSFSCLFCLICVVLTGYVLVHTHAQEELFH